MLFVAISLLAVVAYGQFPCQYVAGPFLSLDLYTLKGNFLNYEGDGGRFHYTPCADGLQCMHNSVIVEAMLDGFTDGINECHYLAQWDPTVQPFYDFAIGTWIFNFSNGEPCRVPTEQLNTSVRIGWNCDPDATHARIVDVFRYDSCNTFVEVEWEGACNPAPPPNQLCEFRSAFQTLNLSTIQGTRLDYKDTHGNMWSFTPCANGLQCRDQRGTLQPVMADIEDPSTQCIKYLGVWSGDSIPFYDRTVIGQNYWDFFWMNGEQCGDGGPAQVLNARYYCNATVHGAVIREVRGTGPCEFIYEIDTDLACD
jgi:hypothetical protein